MRFELYGVLNKSGANTYIKSYRSFKAAIQAVSDEINSLVYPLFIILVKEKQHSTPIRSEAGYTSNGFSSKSASYLKGINPVKLAHTFWEDFRV